MAGSNWQQLAGGSVNPYDVLRDDGTPTADYGQHVICDGGTVTLPSPKANEAVLVSNVSQNTTVTASTGLVEQQSEVFHLSDVSDPVLFVSDGSDWYVANNLDYVATIPDSGISRYEFEGDFTDSWGSNDGSGVNSPSFTNTAQVGSQAISLDNIDNESVHLPTYPDSFFDTGSFAVWIDPSEAGYLVWFGTDSSGESRALQLKDNTYKFVGFSNDFDTGVSPNSGYNLLTVTWDVPNDTATVYRNDANELGSDSTLSLVTPSSQENAFGERRSGGDKRTTALLDDPRTYDKTLSPTEISNLYNTGFITG